MKFNHIELPSIRDDIAGFNYLFKLTNSVMQDPDSYYAFDFGKCFALDQNALAVLGGLSGYLDSHHKNNLKRKILEIILPNKAISFDIDTMSQLIKDQLIKNNFLSYFDDGKLKGYPEGDYIGYRQHLEFLDSGEIADHLKHEWLSSKKIEMHEDLKNAIVSTILEIYMNAYGHGVASNKMKGTLITSCGQFDPKEQILKLTVVDFGCGIIANVRDHKKNNIEDKDAMSWALELGNSTKTDSVDENIPRGLGFDLLKDFVNVNKGKIGIYSNSCCAIANPKGAYTVEKLRYPFIGTIVNIAINCDGKKYKFVSDSSDIEQYF